MIESIKIKVFGEKIEVPRGTTLYELSKNFISRVNGPIIIAKVDNEYKDLFTKIEEPCDITYLSYDEREANRVYVNGLIYLTIVAAKSVIPDNKLTVLHPIDKGIYISAENPISKEDLVNIKNKMKEIVKLNIKFERIIVNRADAIEYFKKIKDFSKVGILKYNTDTFVSIYKLGKMYDYYFSLMPPATGTLGEFDLRYLDEGGFVLLYKTVYMKDGIKPYAHHQKIFEIFKEEHEWSKLMNISNVSSLNDFIADGNAGTLIRISETIQSAKLLRIAKDIEEKKQKIKVVLMSGPSSSGKTTTCNKLCMYLKAFGLKPVTISMDDFFFDREKTPRDENGDYNFECLEAIDVKKFDKTIGDLLEGKKVKMPKFNFITGHADPGDELVLGENEIILVEGIHGLNPEILTNIPRSKKFKIYISPLTGLNLDDNNRISTTDNRLLRRIVRDNVTRGYNVEQTIKAWISVRHGEEKYVFTHQDEADCIFNTSLLYEIGVLKVYVEPLLYSVDINSPYYESAKRLLRLLKVFLPIPSDDIPDDSLLREFIGKSCFKL